MSLQQGHEVEHFDVSWDELLQEAKRLSLPTRRFDVASAKVDVCKDVATLVKRRGWVVDTEGRFTTGRLGAIRAGHTHRWERNIATPALAIVVREAHGRSSDGAAAGVIEARFAEFAGSFAGAEFVHANLAGCSRVLTSKVSTAVRVCVARFCATFLRFHRHRDAVVRNALRAIEVRVARSTFVTLQARFLQDAARPFEERVAVSKVARRYAWRVDRNLAAQVAVALFRHAVANLARVTRGAAVVTTWAIRIGLASVLGAVGVSVSVAFRDAREVRDAFLCAARKHRACRSVRAFANVAVCLGVTCLLVEFARIGDAAALGRVASFAGRAARNHARAFVSKRTLETDAPRIAVRLASHRGAFCVVFDR